jgi:hypothetical protein
MCISQLLKHLLRLAVVPVRETIRIHGYVRAVTHRHRGLRVSRRNAAVWIYRIGGNDLNMLLSLDGLRRNKLVLKVLHD